MASYTKLRYHIVTATSNRQPLICETVEHLIRSALFEKARESGSRMLAVGMTADHMHLALAAPPTITLADLVQILKSASSRAVNRSKLLEAAFHWQRGYGAFTADPSNLEPLIRYVRNQKRHHAEGNLRPMWEQTSRH